MKKGVKSGPTKPVDRYELHGLVRDSGTGKGLPGYRITAYDVDRESEPDFLGRAVTLLNGEFALHFTQDDFIKSVDEKTQEGGPDIVLEVTNRFNRVVKRKVWT